MNDLSPAAAGAPAPTVGLLSNGRYSVLVTAAGTGFSTYDGFALTRWRADPVRDADGFFVYVRELDAGRCRSVGRQPCGPDAPAEPHAGPGVFGWTHRDGALDVRVEVCVDPDEPVELRRVSFVNHGASARRLELTSGAEVVVGDPAADAAHPAFAKLFVQTEWLSDPGALLATRRPRRAGERTAWLFHACAGGETAGEAAYETDRARFIGRGRTAADPAALDPGAALSGTAGNVLDTVVSLRRRLTVAPGASASVVFALGAADDRAGAARLAARFAGPAEADAAFDRARAAGRPDLPAARASGYQLLAAALLYGAPALRPPGAARPPAPVDPARMARYGLGGPRPLLAALEADEALAASLAEAHRYWRDLGLDLGVLLLADRPPAGVAEGFRTVRPAEVPPGDLDLILAAADGVVRGAVPYDALREAFADAPPRPARFRPAPAGSAPPAGEPLRLFNGHGGFSEDGRAYVIRTDGATLPPMPWTNVVANEQFGFLATERGGGYTWSVNSREHRLTPWYNDPVTDLSGEALYVRDEEAGVYWSPTPGPAPAPGAYEIRHGFGQTRWRHERDGLAQETLAFVPLRDPVKLVRLEIENRSGRPRRLSIFRYQEWVLGVFPEAAARQVAVEPDARTGALFARNPRGGEFAERCAFAAAVAPEGAGRSWTADRAAFLGRRGDPARPAAVVSGDRLDEAVRPGSAPCAAFQLRVELAPGERCRVLFLLGEAERPEAARALLAAYAPEGAAEAALAEVEGFWEETLGRLRIETPSPALDLLVNGWLPYQVLACRLWGRSAYYQSGGAFGFRDQLQDSLAFLYTDPARTRAQILLHAAHQFVEGDVMHWWHPPLSRGIRTRFSDDLLWLPFATALYARTTGDRAILDEPVRFLRARALEPHEDEAFLLPEDSGERADLYEHCCRALDRSLTRGAHGLPLMGSGDWNDGMNRVGFPGRGESVWLGFFLHRILEDFLPICDRRGDDARAARYRAYQQALAAALEDAGWDGGWYRRAFYDDGTPLGSAESDECRIDAIAQAWAVLSGVAPDDRAEQALDAAERFLVSEEEGLIRLLTPAFDRTPHDPGYIKGYVPGVRENGGQYTHGVLWLVQALFARGRHETGARLLEMLSPVSHTLTPEGVERYRAEPYVVPADVYGVPPHVGRAGWTWYTGSAAWMYRIVLESLFGLRVEEGRTLVLRPALPASWPSARLRLRLPGGAVHDLRLKPGEEVRVPLG